MKILVLSELSSEVMEKLETELHLEVVNAVKSPLGDGESLNRLLQQYDPEIVVISAHPFGEETFRKCPSLKLIVCTRGNPVNINIEMARKHKIFITNTPARNANAVAEFTFGLMISCLRNIHTANAAIRNGEYLLPENVEIDKKSTDIVWLHPEIRQPPYLAFRGSELFGKTLGLVGAGAIGRLIGEKAKVFGMDIIAYDPYVDESSMLEWNMRKVSLSDLLDQADIISLHAKVTETTRHMIGEKQFDAMRSDAILINTARGALIDQEALYQALSKKKIRCAALDVFEYEPLVKGDPLLSLPNLLITPHIGGASKDVIYHHSNMAYNSISDFVLAQDKTYGSISIRFKFN